MVASFVAITRWAFFRRRYRKLSGHWIEKVELWSWSQYEAVIVRRDLVVITLARDLPEPGAYLACLHAHRPLRFGFQLISQRHEINLGNTTVLPGQWGRPHLSTWTARVGQRSCLSYRYRIVNWSCGTLQVQVRGTNRTMTTFSIRDAAREAGVSKTSILRAIQSGRMSAPRKDDGGYAIDPAELFRVFPPKGSEMGQGDRSGDVDRGQTVPPGREEADHLSTRFAALEAEVQALKELVRRLDHDKLDLKTDRDAWKNQAESAHRLLSVYKEAPAEPQRRGWWPWRRAS
jgi:hypothetical protein